ncbi:immunity protein Imm33 domain-containing protein [Chryseobacterium sp. 'Rf worker isolate 10']|uniref:immunity protein Imm33 domain-containing protein n=1 Tax=Chryseobacterium sp. 'Rf worker isolate 10' TaxID=2887348 RepID=UPI003D6F7344
MILYKEIEVNVNDNIYVETKGLNSYISKEIRVIIGNNQPENYIEVIKYIIDYIIDYIVDSKPIISENQNIGYYSWLLQFRLDEENYYEVYEANSDGSDFNKGCDTAISVVREQSEICWQQNLIPLFPNFNQSVVISDGVYEGKDIEGIRYDSPHDESGWYLITDDYDDNIKSLKMVHFYHVAFARPDILKYLAIPFGYRFIMKEGNIEIHQDEEE